MATPTRDQLAQWFASIDTDRTGTITASELQRALALGGLQFSLMACAQVRL
jgi:Ca2+-binding EF-hand superfamily protein